MAPSGMKILAVDLDSIANGVSKRGVDVVPLVGMDSRDYRLAGRRPSTRINSEYSIHLPRPEYSAGVRIRRPASRMAQPLAFGEICLAPPQLVLHPLPIADVV